VRKSSSADLVFSVEQDATHDITKIDRNAGRGRGSPISSLESTATNSIGLQVLLVHSCSCIQPLAALVAVTNHYSNPPAYGQSKTSE